MTQPTTDNPIEPFSAKATSLMAEYTQKINYLSETARRHVVDGPYADFERLRRLLKRLLPAAKELAQHVSQHLEHAKLDDFTRLELRLRLAEFEHAITEDAQDILNMSLKR